MMSRVRVNALLFGIRELKKHYFNIDFKEGRPDKQIIDKLKEIRDETDKLINEFDECPKCNGEGFIVDLTSNCKWSSTGHLKTVCSECNGTGELK